MLTFLIALRAALRMVWGITRRVLRVILRALSRMLQAV
jgi:hypothetical protein